MWESKDIVIILVASAGAILGLYNAIRYYLDTNARLLVQVDMVKYEIKVTNRSNFDISILEFGTIYKGAESAVRHSRLSYGPESESRVRSHSRMTLRLDRLSVERLAESGSQAYVKADGKTFKSIKQKNAKTDIRPATR